MKIATGCIVEIEYELFDAEGELVENSKEGGPMVYLHGNEEIPEGLEKELEGRQKGDKLHVALPPGEAYGEYNPDGLVSVPREQFPPDAEIVPGDWIDVTLADAEGKEPQDAESIEMKVIEISPESIVLDANHPLAGQACTFDLTILSVRKASQEEIEDHKRQMELKEEPEEEGEQAP
ncbi:MAG TPA: peptidylprolyl isomerase [Planctomycetota bacterium]|nr:peptidylprolyl isomerase [Planctomycetota bacterium]